jgi:ketosteroid isomerase-like protein
MDRNAYSVSPSVVQAFYQAYASRQAERVAPLIADNVNWIIVGPSQILPFCGEHHGKAAVLKLFTDVMPAAINFRSFQPEVLVIDGDRVASFVKLSGFLRNGGRVITYHCGQFVRFENDKVVCFHSIIDSFDAAEQALGHQIDPLYEPARPAPIETDRAIIAI